MTLIWHVARVYVDLTGGLRGRDSAESGPRFGVTKAAADQTDLAQPTKDARVARAREET